MIVSFLTFDPETHQAHPESSPETLKRWNCEIGLFADKLNSLFCD
jgi:hypothetical protein